MRKNLDPESRRNHTPPPSSLPSVGSMAGKGKGSIDRTALAVFVFALILFVILAYGFLNSMKGEGPYSPAKSASQFLNDLKRYVEGYIEEIERVFKPHESRKREAKKHIFAGYTKYKEKKFHNALREFNRAVKVDPENAEAYFWRGRVLMSINRYEEATPDFEMAVKLNPAHVDAYNNLGWLCARAGNYHESISNLTKAIELKPDNGWAYYYRGRINKEIGEVRMAMKDAEEACRLGFQDGCILYERLKAEYF